MHIYKFFGSLFVSCQKDYCRYNVFFFTLCIFNSIFVIPIAACVRVIWNFYVCNTTNGGVDGGVIYIKLISVSGSVIWWYLTVTLFNNINTNNHNTAHFDSFFCVSFFRPMKWVSCICLKVRVCLDLTSTRLIKCIKRQLIITNRRKLN